MYAAGDGQAPAQGGWRVHFHSASPPLPLLFGAPAASRGRRPRAPAPASRGAALPLLPAKLSSPDCVPGPRAGAPAPRAEPGQARTEGVPGPGAASARGQPPALGGARRAGYKASARWSLRLLLAQSISARRSPGARGARASRRGRTHLPEATCARREPPGKLCGPRGGGGRRRPPVPGRSPPPSPARPPARSPSTAASRGSSSSAAPSLRRAMAALPGASGRGAAGPGRQRAPRARGAGGERRGAAHTQPPPPRSQQNEPSSPGRTGTRAPPALGTAHLSRGRGGSPARPPPPALARDPSWPRAPPEPEHPQRLRAHPGGGAGAGARRPRASGRRRPGAPPAQQWSLPALWLLQIKQRFQPKCF